MWELKRREQLKKLDKMLRVLYTLNKGSSFIQNLKNCINITASLLFTDINNTRQNFIQFLTSEACKEEKEIQSDNICDYCENQLDTEQQRKFSKKDEWHCPNFSRFKGKKLYERKT